MNGLRSLNKTCCHDHELLVNVEYGEAKANMSTKCTVNFIDEKKMKINISISRNFLFVFMKHFLLMHAMLESY